MTCPEYHNATGFYGQELIFEERFDFQLIPVKEMAAERANKTNSALLLVASQLSALSYYLVIYARKTFW